MIRWHASSFETNATEHINWATYALAIAAWLVIVTAVYKGSRRDALIAYGARRSAAAALPSRDRGTARAPQHPPSAHFVAAARRVDEGCPVPGRSTNPSRPPHYSRAGACDAPAHLRILAKHSTPIPCVMMVVDALLALHARKPRSVSPTIRTRTTSIPQRFTHSTGSPHSNEFPNHAVTFRGRGACMCSLGFMPGSCTPGEEKKSRSQLE